MADYFVHDSFRLAGLTCLGPEKHHITAPVTPGCGIERSFPGHGLLLRLPAEAGR
jgi:hypothetical protein